MATKSLMTFALLILPLAGCSSTAALVREAAAAPAGILVAHAASAPAHAAERLPRSRPLTAR